MAYIPGFGGPADRGALKLETRKRNWINNSLRLDGTPEQMRAAARIITDAYPNARPVSTTKLYNCYGMVFAARRTWIVDSQDVELILRDDEYRKLPWDPRTWLPGDVVVYRDGDNIIKHVAVIAEITWNDLRSDFDISVISTWGESGEFIHPLKTVSPFWGGPTEVRSQRFLL